MTQLMWKTTLRKIKMKNNKCYLLFQNKINDETGEKIGESVILGIFTDECSIREIQSSYEDIFGAIENGVRVELETQEFKYNTLVVYNEDDFDRVNRYNKEKSEAYEKLVKEGILDYSIDENGDFVFGVTPKGQKLIEDKESED